MNSGVEGIPVPVEAVAFTGEKPPGAWTAYDLPDSVTLDNAVRWYEHHLPEQRGFGNWAWCRRENYRGPLPVGAGQEVTWSWVHTDDPVPDELLVDLWVRPAEGENVLVTIGIRKDNDPQLCD